MSVRDRLEKVTAGAPALPLVVLFGLNAVDELDRTAFGVLTPEIRDAFGLSNQGILGVVTAFSLVIIILGLPIAYQADKRSRVRMATGGAVAWSFFSVMTGLAPVIAVLLLARIGSGLGKAVVEPTHNSLLADYYPPESRARVYYVHRLANSVGQFVGPAVAGVLAAIFTWRTPFIVFAVPTVVFVVLALRLREPRRGYWDKRAAGATDEEANAEVDEPALAFGEAWRMLWHVRSLRRVYASLPFLSASLLGIATLLNLFWEDVYGLNSAERGFLESAAEAFQVVGILAGAVFVQRILDKRPALVLRSLALAGVAAGGALALTALSPALIGSIIGRVLFSVIAVSLFPGIYAVGSLVLPARSRALGFSAASIFGLPGLLFLPVAGAIGDSQGLRAGLMFMLPVYLIGSLILASAGGFVDADAKRNAESTRAQADAKRARAEGKGKLLIVRGLNVSYSGTQVLFDVDFDVADGEIVALLGTNGAGKSTLLKGICGLASVDAGAVVFDGEDITSLDAISTTKKGIVQMPGGRGVFPSLTVAENLKAAGWLYRGDSAHMKERTDRVLEYFPILTQRWNTKAGSLSGGQQQMLSLGMAFIAQPKLLMIDELTLGLAPTVVEDLLKILRAIHAGGTAIVLVEQSVNVALRLADRAVFLEKGEVRFTGPTKDLLERGDILRAVYLQGAGAADDDATPITVDKERAAGLLDNPVVLETIDISKRYGGITAVNAVSLKLHQDEILGLIGPNGAGKTTVMDLVSGFQGLDGGRVLLHGQDVTDWPASARARFGLGRSFQDARLWPTLTVKENLAVALERAVPCPDALLAAFNMPETRDSEAWIHLRVEELIELMRVGAFRDKFVGELSTGSRRMVELAAVLAHRPSVLLLDEPSSGIAQKETEALGPVLRDVQSQLSCSIIVIEHDMPLLTTLADRIVALDQGTVVVTGTADEVLTHPQVIESYLGGATDYGELAL
jgi:ABC-type branched-subunit amino acid transport system ATPase component/predicted MFS family arabinose efflux permease